MSSDPLLPPSGLNGASTSATAGRSSSAARQRWTDAVRALFAKAPTNGARVAESLDYEPIQNHMYLERLKLRKGKRHVYGYSGLTLAKNLVIILTGLLTGLVSVCVNRGVENLISWRNRTMADMIDTSHGVPWVAFGINMGYGVTLTSIAACLVTFWAPAAAGAGVTLVMAYLNGNHIPNLLRWKTLVTKVIGATCGVASGLAIGPEGPMVHIGACIASNITYANCVSAPWLRWLWPWGTCNDIAEGHADEEESLHGDPDTSIRQPAVCATWEELHEDSEHREFISAGAAAGLSAAFGAPIGGVLFSMEEACSFWTRKVAWRCFIAAILAAFTISQLSEDGDSGVIVFSNVRTLHNADTIKQLPFMIAVAAVGGILGALFNTLRRALWPLRASRSRKLLRIIESLLIIAFGVTLQFFMAHYLGECKTIPGFWDEAEFTGIRWRCPEGQHNDLATAFFSPCDGLLSRMFSVGEARGDAGKIQEDHSGFRTSALFMYGTAYLVMMALASGVCVPAGLFMPSIVVGASFGLWCGLYLQKLLPADMIIQPGMYALICATAALTGVFRSAISLVVLVVEGTRGINFLFGIITSVVVANWVANILEHDGVYESEIERDGNVFFLRHEPPHQLATLSAKDIMVRRPTCFNTIVSVKEVLRVLQRTTHHGFPVVEEWNPAASTSGASEGAGQLEGLVLRSQLLVLLKGRVFCNAEGRPLNSLHRSMATQFRIERTMRLFYRLRYTHHRYMSTRDPAIDSISDAMSRSRSRVALGGTNGTNGANSSNGAQHNGVDSLDVLPSIKQSDTGGTVFNRDVKEIESLHDAVKTDDRNDDELQELYDIFETVPSVDDLHLDLRPYMNTAPLTVRKEMSAARVHRTFVTLGMRHLCVVSNKNHVIGIITRKDLDHAAEHGAGHDAGLHVSHSILASKARAVVRPQQPSITGNVHRRGMSGLNWTWTADRPVSDDLPQPVRSTESTAHGFSSERFAGVGAAGQAGNLPEFPDPAMDGSDEATGEHGNGSPTA